VGCGSGYLLAVFGHMVGERGKVVGIDHFASLTQLSRDNLSKNHKALLDQGRVEIVTGDGRKGHAVAGPYDAIHVGAASPTMVQALIDQLKSPGRMFIPVGTYAQSIYVVDKDEAGKVTQKRIMGVSYVPLD